MVFLWIIEASLICIAISFVAISIYEKKQRKNNRNNAEFITQKEVMDESEVFAFCNQGGSLNDCVIYQTRYSKMGYSED